MQRFKNKIVIVTGGVTGIGKNIAAAFKKEGARIFIADQDAKVAKQISAEFLKVDLSQKGEPQAMIHTVVRKAGRLDILVNNASAGEKISLADETEENWEVGMSVNLRAAFFAAQEAIKAMKKKGGCIVNISSVAASVTCHQSPSYHLAKAGMVQMTRYLAAYAGPSGVRVNSVSPGFIVKDENRERFNRRDNQQFRKTAKFCHPLGDVGTSDDVAKAVLFLCSEDSRFITGQDLVVDGGLTLQEQSGLVFRFGQEK